MMLLRAKKEGYIKSCDDESMTNLRRFTNRE